MMGSGTPIPSSTGCSRRMKVGLGVGWAKIRTTSGIGKVTTTSSPVVLLYSSDRVLYPSCNIIASMPLSLLLRVREKVKGFEVRWGSKMKSERVRRAKNARCMTQNVEGETLLIVSSMEVRQLLLDLGTLHPYLRRDPLGLLHPHWCPPWSRTPSQFQSSIRPWS